MADIKSLSSKKVAGVPVLYLVGGFVAIMAVIAWRMKPSAAADTTATDPTTATTDPGTSTDAVPPAIVGTVTASNEPAVQADAPYEDNSTWMRKAVAFLIAHGANPGDAQLAMQHYLGGANLSYQEGQLRDQAVREYGLPPDGFDAGTTAGKPATSPTPSPTPVKTPVTPVPKPPVGKPVPPKPAPPAQKAYIVRRGDTLSGIATSFFHVSWQALYARNRSVIGNNPNLIKPGMRLVYP